MVLQEQLHNVRVDKLGYLAFKNNSQFKMKLRCVVKEMCVNKKLEWKY